ncbi:TlpA disulfide reductase family protein [Sulfitobacter sp. F26169L]|uniref:TlpA family protein disulfide reductase n=1 Tax=Sulfitobacter sp. F26169L TaxID=2996015 RepID=UPI002260BE95|nr:TlpA disulfide reductase family protein [Sulfitobacter sp. F26169L]MCX7567256.1 TlpA disulfide reductase family protein [Sulfitobacter sp. F26169L]
MKKLLLALVYTALTAGANPALAADADIMLPLVAGDMKKLVIHDAPKSTSSAAFELADDAGRATLEDYRGKYVLVNFWATWCAPCRKEMPHLSELQEELAGKHFEVLTIATGRNSAASIAKFFKDVGISNLPHHMDPNQALASQMGIFGLPITVLLDPEGREIARLRGDADWASDSAKSIIKALIEKHTAS